LKKCLKDEKANIYVNGHVVRKKNEVWKRLSAKIRNIKEISSDYLYTIVIQNRYDTNTVIGIDESNSELCDENEIINTDLDESSDNSNTNKMSFNFILTSSEWKDISPESVLYSDKRTYSVLKRNVWTHIINKHFWNHTRLQYRLKYSGGRVYTSDRAIKYLFIKGICTFCYSTLHVSMDNAPQSEDDVTMVCTYKGNYKIMHPIGLKRNLAGASRINAIKKMTNEHLAPSVFRRHQANALMEFGGPEPSYLPSGNVLRTAKCKSLREKRIHDDTILAVAKAMHKISYQGIIHDVSYDKLMIRYHSPAQLHVYNEYCKNNKFPSVFIDATGNIIKKVMRDNGRNCGNIFLYSCVIRDQKAKQIYPVCNMISELHDTETIRHWLTGINVCSSSSVYTISIFE